jgi:hypothetical protein
MPPLLLLLPLPPLQLLVKRGSNPACPSSGRPGCSHGSVSGVFALLSSLRPGVTSAALLLPRASSARLGLFLPWASRRGRPGGGSGTCLGRMTSGTPSPPCSGRAGRSCTPAVEDGAVAVAVALDDGAPTRHTTKSRRPVGRTPQAATGHRARKMRTFRNPCRRLETLAGGGRSRVPVRPLRWRAGSRRGRESLARASPVRVTNLRTLTAALKA